MQRKNQVRRVLSILLSIVLILTMMPIAAFAAQADGWALATEGTNQIEVHLNSGQFSATSDDVTNVLNWTLITASGKTITSISRQSDDYVQITLSGNVVDTDSFTIDAAAGVFQAGTEPFATPLNVSIGYFAEGTATSAAGSKDITVTLTKGVYHNSPLPIFWTLGGASAAANPITDVVRNSDTQVTVRLTNNIDEADIYTITADQNVFTTVAVRPFVSPLSVTVTPLPTEDAEWHYRSPMPSNNIIERAEFLNGKYFAVGYNGTLISSVDGASWQKVDVGAETDRLTSITYGNGKYVIVSYADSNGYVARIFTSDNGLTWRETAAIPDHGLHDVIFANGEFIAVGEAGKIIVSDDGETWQIITTNSLTPDALNYNLLAVTYANGKYVAAGTRIHTGIAQRGAVLTSVDGVSWSVKQTDTDSTVWDVSYGDGVYAAVGGVSYTSGSYFISTSTDGETWTPRSVPGAPTYARFYSVTYDGSKFIAAGTTTGTDSTANKACLVTSSDGNTWSYLGDQSKPSFKAVASNAAGTLYVAMGGTGNIYTSDDGGSNWTYQTLGITKTLRDVAWNGSLFVAVGMDGTIQTSPDGEIWTIRASGTPNNLNDIDYFDGQLIAVGDDGTIITSGNGSDWAVRNSGTTEDLLDIAFGEGTYITGGNAAARISTDGGISWSMPTGLITLRTVAYGNGGFVALSQYGQAFHSDDGVNWISCGSLDQFSEYPMDMIFVEDNFVAVGGYGKVFLSSDNGVNWTLAQTDINQDYILDITYGDGKLAAVANNGKIIASADGGLNWFLQPSNLSLNPYFSLNEDAQLYGIATGSDSFVAVGGNGLILQSEDFSISTNPDTHDVALAKSRLFSDDIKGSGSNSNLGSIVASMGLMSSWNYDTSVTWASSKPQYVAASGAVTRPAFADGGQVVELTATISKGSASDTKKFLAVVVAQPDPDIAAVDAAVNALTFDVIKMGNTAENNITSNLNLTTAGINATSISWSSSKPAYITTGGAVARPAEGDDNESVTLTATITNGFVSRTRSFNLTVQALVSQDALNVAAAIAALTFNTIKGSNTEAESITSNLNLSTAGISGTAISWNSNKPAIITTGGAVTRPAQGSADEDVILSAAVSNGTASQIKQFTVRVKAMPSAPPPGNPDSPAGSNRSTPAPAYTADVSGTNTSGTLPINVNAGSNSATVIAGTQQGDSVTGGNPVVIEIPSIPGVHSFTLDIPADYLSAASGEGALTLTTGTGSVTMPSNMLANTEGEKATITISEGDTSSLSDEIKAIIGSRPIIQLTLTMDGQQTEWNNPDAPVAVTIPYTPAAEELQDPEHIVIWYIDGSGNAVSVPSGRFDPVTGTVTFSTTHFSNYAIAFVHKTFADLNGTKWAKKAIEVMASKGVINGTGKDSCSPKTCITRADYMVMLVKGLGLTADYKENFADVKSGTYYYEALGIARELGIATGNGENLFRPKEKISRQDMMVLTARALEKAKKLKTGSNSAVLDQFSDKDRIAGYAAESLAALVQNELVTGSGNKLNPRGDTTRAEAAVFLYRIYNQ